MSKLEIVEKYLEILFSDGNPDELEKIFSNDLQFKGPLFQFESAAVYIESLKSNPPVGFECELIESFEKDSKVSIFYNFSKGEVRTPMAQLFEFENDLIRRILLIFDSTHFT